MRGAGDVSSIVDTSVLKRLGFSFENQDTWPDVILYFRRKRWVYLVDIAALNGPISFPRRQELEAMLANQSARCTYVSAFLDFKQFKRHGFGIAWGTEVWIAEVPDHLIHFNGDKYLSPHRPLKRKARSFK